MLWALWFAAEGMPRLDVLVIFVLGAILTRSAGCVINDFADRKIDGQVERTKDRPLATGALSAKEALGFAAILMLIAFALVLFTNRLTIVMSFMALFLATLYPFTKRFTHLPQLFLGAAFGFAIPMAYAAQTGYTNEQTWWLYLAGILWAMAYDTYYAMADRADDMKLGVKSSAILFGNADLWVVGAVQLSVLTIVFAIGLDAQRGWPFILGILIAAALAVYQLIISRHRDPKKCFEAFLNNNYLGMAVFIGIAADYLLVGAG
jgi:4-hydroxybenzoate polyprenyltransferase